MVGVPVLIFSVTLQIPAAIITSELEEKPLHGTGELPGWLQVSPARDAAGALISQPFTGTAEGHTQG